MTAAETASINIPDNNPTGIRRTFNFSGSDLRVEHVVVTTTIEHPYRGDLAITLISPHGTSSRLAEPHADPNPDYDDFSFTSTFHWGEISTGEWTVHIADAGPGDTRSLVSLAVEIFGTAPVAPELKLVQQSPEDLTLIVDGHAGRLNVIETSENLTNWTTRQEVNWFNGPYEVQLPLETETRFYRVRIPAAE